MSETGRELGEKIEGKGTRRGGVGGETGWDGREEIKRKTGGEKAKEEGFEGSIRLKPKGESKEKRLQDRRKVAKPGKDDLTEQRFHLLNQALIKS